MTTHRTQNKSSLDCYNFDFLDAIFVQTNQV